jgi:hypothetical protein
VEDGVEASSNLEDEWKKKMMVPENKGRRKSRGKLCRAK